MYNCLLTCSLFLKYKQTYYSLNTVLYTATVASQKMSVPGISEHQEHASRKIAKYAF
jgi:hypothetical protein